MTPFSIWARLFGTKHRRAKQAEAEGRLEDAAELFAHDGALAEQARVLCQAAQGATDPWRRVELARNAAKVALDADDAWRRASVEAFAGAVHAWTESAGALDRRDRELLAEVGSALASIGRSEAAGDAYARAGWHEHAAEAYTAAGAVDRLEASAWSSELERGIDDGLEAQLGAYELAMMRRDYVAARHALDEAATIVPDDVRLADLREELARRFPAPGRLRVRLDDDEEVVLIAAAEVIVGRDPSSDIVIRGPGVSRRHLVLRREGAAFVASAEDGAAVTIDGAPAPTTLEGSGVLTLGTAVSVAYECTDAVVTLRPRGGQVRYQLGRSVTIALTSGTLTLEVKGGYWHVLPSPSLRVDGDEVQKPSVLMRGARIALGDATCAVRD